MSACSYLESALAPALEEGREPLPRGLYTHCSLSLRLLGPSLPQAAESLQCGRNCGSEEAPPTESRANCPRSRGHCSPTFHPACTCQPGSIYLAPTPDLLTGPPHPPGARALDGAGSCRNGSSVWTVPHVQTVTLVRTQEKVLEGSSGEGQAPPDHLAVLEEAQAGVPRSLLQGPSGQAPEGSWFSALAPWAGHLLTRLQPCPCSSPSGHSSGKWPVSLTASLASSRAPRLSAKVEATSSPLHSLGHRRPWRPSLEPDEAASPSQHSDWAHRVIATASHIYPEDTEQTLDARCKM